MLQLVLESFRLLLDGFVYHLPRFPPGDYQVVAKDRSDKGTEYGHKIGGHGLLCLDNRSGGLPVQRRGIRGSRD